MSQQERLQLRLYVVDGELNSQLARGRLESALAEYGPASYQLEVIDVLVDFQAALDDQILVTPALVIVSPKPTITIFGNLADMDKLRAALSVKLSV